MGKYSSVHRRKKGFGRLRGLQPTPEKRVWDDRPRASEIQQGLIKKQRRKEYSTHGTLLTSLVNSVDAKSSIERITELKQSYLLSPQQSWSTQKPNQGRINAINWETICQLRKELSVTAILGTGNNSQKKGKENQMPPCPCSHNGSNLTQ